MLKPLKLGSLRLRSNIIYSPLAGCSDLPFREMCLPYRPGLFFCEMVKMDALVRHDLSTYRLLDYTKEMHPIGAQLCGSKPSLAGDAAKIIEDLGFDALDLNCGCPVDKVTKDGSGSGLLKTPELIGEILNKMVSSVNIPVTVKIRAGWDEDSILAGEITQIAENAGAKAISVHGRTRKQAYRGNANWDYVKQAKEAAKNILVFGNGDVFTPSAAKSLFDQTGCDGLLVSRATMGQPWIYEDIADYLQGIPPKVRNSQLYKETLLKHFNSIRMYQTHDRAILSMRRVGCWYLRKGKGTKRLREALNRSKSLEEMHELIENYAWDEVDYG